MTALNFPASPFDGQVYRLYKYSEAIDAWSHVSSKLSDFEDVASAGILTTGSALVYNSSSESWIGDASVQIPVGSVTPHAGATAPEDHLLCNGAVLLIAEYPELYSVIGKRYNTSGELSTQFRLPNISGKVVVGLDSIQPSFDRLGKAGGNMTHTLMQSEMPGHTHIQNSHTHTQDAHNHTQDAHSHGISIWWNPNDWENGSFGLGYFGSWQNSLAVTGGWTLGTDSRTPNIANTTATNQNATATNQNTGGGQSHTNLQPYTVLNYIIKYRIMGGV